MWSLLRKGIQYDVVISMYLNKIMCAFFQHPLNYKGITLFLSNLFRFLFSEEVLAGSGSGSGDFSIETTEFEPKVRIKEDEEDFFTTQLSPSSTRTPEVIRPTSTASTTTMSLTRALIQYILPMVLVWFGGAITNLL